VFHCETKAFGLKRLERCALSRRSGRAGPALAFDHDIMTTAIHLTNGGAFWTDAWDVVRNLLGVVLVVFGAAAGIALLTFVIGGILFLLGAAV
jgi:hypothetical protein